MAPTLAKLEKCYKIRRLRKESWLSNKSLMLPTFSYLNFEIVRLHTRINLLIHFTISLQLNPSDLTPS